MTELRVHFWPEGAEWYACGARVLTISSESGGTDDRGLVSCKRCLASLAKRDREFRRKARSHWPKYYPNRDGKMEFGWNPCFSLANYTSPAAIAREEGRS